MHSLLMVGWEAVPLLDLGAGKLQMPWSTVAAISGLTYSPTRRGAGSRADPINRPQFRRAVEGALDSSEECQGEQRMLAADVNYRVNGVVDRAAPAWFLPLGPGRSTAMHWSWTTLPVLNKPNPLRAREYLTCM